MSPWKRVPMEEVIKALHANGLPGYEGKATDAFVVIGSRFWDLEYYETKKGGNRMISMNNSHSYFTRHKSVDSAARTIVKWVRFVHRETGKLLGVK